MSSKETGEILTYAMEVLSYEDGKLFHKVRRSTVKVGQRAGTDRPDGYRDVRIKGNKFLEHRVIWAICTGSWPNGEIDHIDRNPSNNDIANLRVVDRYVNTSNVDKKVTNNSGHKNVYWNNINKRWRVALRVNGVRHNLGSFISLEDAIMQRDLFMEEVGHAYT